MMQQPIPASSDLAVDVREYPVAGAPAVVPRPMPMPTPGLSVVVPVWNGARRLAPMIEHIERFRETCALSSELILVDDCSAAPTVGVLERVAANTRGVRMVRNERNRGKGFSVRRGMLAARGAYRVFIDADLAYLPTEITKIVDALDAGAEVAIACRELPGSRYVTNSALFGYTYARHLTSRVFNLVVRHALLPGILDSQAGLKGFTAEAAECVFPLVSTAGFGFDVECLYLACTQGWRIAQTPVTVQCDDHLTTIHLGRDSIRMLRDVARIRWRARHRAYGDTATAGA
jgi:dolichyl-phosphate beta-glucosyltransferase